MGPWKSGKFMHLSQGSANINTYCLSEVLFKCSSIDTRTMDTATITASIKSWLFQDQLVKPEDFLLYRNRANGGMGLIVINPKVKAQALFIKWFLETAVNEKFLRNEYHEAIFGTSMRCSSRSAFGQSTGNDVSGLYFHFFSSFFPSFFSSTVATFSHRRNARIKKPI